MRACSEAASARGPTALKLSPGGDINPFCDAPTATSMPQSSIRTSVHPSEATTSAMKRAGCEAASIASRTARRSLVTPFMVSVCTASTALMRSARSARS